MNLNRLLFAILSVLLISSCSTNSLLPSKPQIGLNAARINNFGLTEQTFMFYLSVNNENNFALPVLGTDFVASFNGIEVASGNANDAVTIAANSTGEFAVLVTTDLLKSAGSMASGFNFNEESFDYELQGKLFVKLLGASVGVPYKVVGNAFTESQ